MTTTSGNKAPKRKFSVRVALFKVFQFLVTFATTLIICGFIAFVLHVNSAKPSDPLQKADGIVVLTGTGGGRLGAGALLLKDGYGERLLISGVNKSIDAEKIKSLLGLDDEKFECCVDLDYEAENTFDNGQETANWARALGFENILLVTSSYHMPRAKIEISTAMHGINIMPYPVPREKKDSDPWWGGWPNLKGLVREYGKLLVTYAREPGRRPAVKLDALEMENEEIQESDPLQ